MMASHRCFRIGTLTILFGVPVPMRAQVTASVGPIVGYYRPFGHFDPASVYTTDLPSEPRDLRGFMAGGAAHLSLGRRFGLETHVTIAHSSIPAVITPGGPRGPTKANVDIATLEGEYDVSPTRQRYRVWLKAGPALERHGGDAYARYGSPTSVGGAAGAGLTVPLGRRFHFAADVTTLWYVFDLAMPPELQLNPGRLQHGAQRDALMQVGLRWGHL